jgi:2'-5' RNA ligase
MPPTESALIVPVPEAEPVVATHRLRLDSSAPLGVPAHITVLYPFLPPARLDEPALAHVARVAAAVPAFFLRLTETAWFGDRVLWLAPDPAEPFRRLTAEITALFPGVRPYDGEHEQVIPHLTVGHDHPLPALEEAADAVRVKLPILARAGAVRLLIGGGGEPWTTAAEFPLG